MAAELKSYTIVPDNLYVERKADKQLHNIVEAMQRPGYVLVSRQMGKTNLLLRAKRKWENSEDLYVYIDMSNIDETEKACFESLIDTAIDTHEDILSSVREQINDLRIRNIAKSPVQAHNEELRTLLKAVKGKLVFILDEIDSLTRTSFSDNVFSQIRSTYFSRVNYPVLEKLTYVLSGVVEPTEIIKNPKISPFNIGEKIHLDDFTHDEYLTFINQAELSWLGEDVIERVYYWAEGNPRITWDICYELQNKTDLTPAKVDAFVKDLYLTSYDKAPIDTIRSLVKEDRDLRDAIIQLAYDKGNTLSDKIKSKLYLAGIVNYSDNDVKIKNRIINDSLSLKWLQKVEEEEKGLLAYAIELHSKGFFQESINKFELFLKNNDFPESEAPYYYYYMGSCCYHLKDFERSLFYFTTKLIDSTISLGEYRNEQFLCGLDCINLGRYAEALEYFEKAMSGESRDSLYYSAQFNSLVAKQKAYIDNDEKIKEVENGYLAILSQESDTVDNELRLYAAYQLAGLYIFNNKEEAVKYYDIALSYASDLAKPKILIEKFRVIPDEKRLDLLDEIITSVSQIETIEDTPDPEKNLVIDETVLIKVLYLVYLYAHESWDDVKVKISLLPYSYGDVLFKMFIQSPLSTDLWSAGSLQLITELHDNIRSAEYGIAKSSILYIYEYYAFLIYSKKAAKEYFEELKASGAEIDSIGLTVVRTYALSLLEEKKTTDISKELDWIIDRYPTQFTHQDAVPRAVFEYALLVSYYTIGDGKSTVEIAKLILTYIDDEISRANESNKVTLQQVKKNALQALSIYRNRKPVRMPKKYGRNDRITVKYLGSNQVIENKYKYLEKDIVEGLCVIVESKF
jgi:tetratricopeptide (TPR) repeat protein